MYDQVNEMTQNLEDKKVFTLIDLLLIIYKNEKQARQNATKYFDAILKIRLNYNTFKYDVSIDNFESNKKMKPENQSLLIKSLFPDVEFYDHAFWEHIMHLVYLTAFGTIRQWHEMWEEFMLIKPYLQKAADKEIERAKEVIEGIEKYITTLQEAQNK
jgi:hypothetical protein